MSTYARYVTAQIGEELILDVTDAKLRGLSIRWCKGPLGELYKVGLEHVFLATLPKS